MNIIMIITDSASYKNYAELCTFIKQNNINITLSYYFFNMNVDTTFLSHPKNNNICLRWVLSSLGKYIETNNDGGFVLQKLIGSNIIFKILSNFIQNRKMQTNLTTEPFGDIKYLSNNVYNNWDDMENMFSKIPKADMYLISMRDYATRYIQIFLALYLYTQHHSNVLLGGGGLNRKNALVDLINNFSKLYCDDKIYYSYGDIVTTVIDKVENDIYTNRYTQNIVVPDYSMINSYEMKNILNNNVFINLTTGCLHNCDYCISSHVSIWRKTNDIDKVKNNILFLHNTYPEATITFFDNEIDSVSDEMLDILTFLNDYKIKNKIVTYANIYNIDKYINYFNKLNIKKLCVSADLFLEKNTCRSFNNTQLFYDNLLLLKKSNITLDVDHITHIPEYDKDYLNNDKIIFLYDFCLNNNISIVHNEFDLRISSNMYHMPEKFNITYKFYENGDKVLYPLQQYIHMLPELYYKPVNRIDRVLDIYNFLKNYKQLYKKAINEYVINKPLLYASLLGRLTYMCYIDMDVLKNRDNTLNKFIEYYMKCLILNKKGFFMI